RAAQWTTGRPPRGSGRKEPEPAPKPMPPGVDDASSEALARRAQQLADAIDAADLEARTADLPRLTQLTPDEASRKLAIEAAAHKPPSPRETAEQKIARLERRARDIAEA